MRIAGRINRSLYERVRFYLMRGWWPNFRKPRSVNEWLVARKLTNDFERPELSGKVEGYEFAARMCPDLAVPDVVALIDERGEGLPDALQPGHYIFKGSRGSGMIRKFTVDERGLWSIPRDEILLSLIHI